jgi:general secretion pathway protein B
VDKSIAATQNTGTDTARIAADEETVRHQKETAATLKETAQVLKATAESLREKAEQTRQAAVAARAAEQSLSAGGGSRTAASVTTVRLSSGANDSEGTEPVTRHIYRPSDSEAAGGFANADLSNERAADQEGSLPRVMTSNAGSGKSRWTTATAAGEFPELKVSEIHYQYEVENRLAVVNDLPVMEGTVIDGARVDRILKDRVRFIFNGQYKEIRVSK